MKRAIFTTLVFGFLASTAYAQASPWWDGNWGYRQQLTFDNSGQGSALNDFPVLVRLTSTNFNFSNAAANGGDIRFIDSDGTTQLAYEIERWDPSTSSAEIWVRVPNIPANSTTDHIWMYFGNGAVATTQNPSQVWDTNFVMVQHLADATASTTTDSTLNGNNGTKTAVDQPIESGGTVGRAQTFDGGNDAINCGNAASVQVTANLTAEFWVNPTAAATWDYFFGNTANGNWGTGWGFFVSAGTTRFYCGSWTAGVAISTTALSLGNWQHYVGVRDQTSGQVRIYRNGVQEAQVNWAGTITNGPGMFIGSDGGSYNTNGGLDEVRLSNTARSADWIMANYLTQSQSNFPSYGAEEAGVGGGTGGTTTGGGGVVWYPKDNDNGDQDFYRDLCSAGSGSNGFGFLVLVILMLPFLRRR